MTSMIAAIILPLGACFEMTCEVNGPARDDDPVEIGIGAILSQESSVLKRVEGRRIDSNIREGLLWLARHQNEDGSWSVNGYLVNCGRHPDYAVGECSPNPGFDDFNVGVTGLALLAFLGAGFNHASGDTYQSMCMGEVVRKGWKNLVSLQDLDGCVGSRKNKKYMYGHLLGGIALVQAYAMTRDEALMAPARRSVEFTLHAQNPGLGWRYSYQSGDNDSSIVGWAVEHLAAARRAGFKLPKSAYEGARAWFDAVTVNQEKSQLTHGKVGYTHKGTGKVFIPKVNQDFEHHETLSAMGMAARILMGAKKSHPLIRAGAEHLLRDKPVWSKDSIDFYYWHHATKALLLHLGSQNSKWRSWKTGLRRVLVARQNSGSRNCSSGSWPAVSRWGGEGGRVYGNALNVLTLEYLTLPVVFRRASRSEREVAAPDRKDQKGNWIIHLTTGGKLTAASYEILDGKYKIVLARGGTISLPKGNVLTIEKVGATPKK